MKTFATLLLTTALSGTAFAQALEVTPTGVAYGNGGTRTETKDNAGQMSGRSGFYETSNPNPATSWYPGAGSWQHLIEARHSNTGNNFALQIAGGFFDQNLWFRKTANDPSAGWSKFVAQNSAGNVGIGTDTPQFKLEVLANSWQPIVANSTNPGGGGFTAHPNNINQRVEFAVTGPSYPGGAGNARIWMDGDAFWIQRGSGNVGIGTITPFGKLSVSSGNGDALNVYNPGDDLIALQTTLNGQPLSAYGGDYYNRLLLQPIVGNVGIGTYNPTHKLTVNGQVRSKGFITDTSNWSDYVFAEDYKLASLDEVEAHIKEKRHLPGVPSEAEVVSKGLDLGQMSAVQMAKIEELMLHVIELNKQVKAQQARIEQLENQSDNRGVGEPQRNQP